jgi:hypothetical protein
MKKYCIQYSQMHEVHNRLDSQYQVSMLGRCIYYKYYVECTLRMFLLEDFSTVVTSLFNALVDGNCCTVEEMIKSLDGQLGLTLSTDTIYK